MYNVAADFGDMQFYYLNEPLSSVFGPRKPGIAVSPIDTMLRRHYVITGCERLTINTHGISLPIFANYY